MGAACSGYGAVLPKRPPRRSNVSLRPWQSARKKNVLFETANLETAEEMRWRGLGMWWPASLGRGRTCRERLGYKPRYGPTRPCALWLVTGGPLARQPSRDDDADGTMAQVLFEDRHRARWPHGTAKEHLREDHLGLP